MSLAGNVTGGDHRVGGTQFTGRMNLQLGFEDRVVQAQNLDGECGVLDFLEVKQIVDQAAEKIAGANT